MFLLLIQVFSAAGVKSQTTVVSTANAVPNQVCEISYSDSACTTQTGSQNCYSTNGLTCDGMRTVKQGLWGLDCDFGFTGYGNCCIANGENSFNVTCGPVPTTVETNTVCTTFYSDTGCSERTTRGCLNTTSTCASILALKASDYQSLCANFTAFGQCCSEGVIAGIGSIEVDCGPVGTVGAANVLGTSFAFVLPLLMAMLSYFRMWWTF